jgi:hypothetical protein
MGEWKCRRFEKLVGPWKGGDIYIYIKAWKGLPSTKGKILLSDFPFLSTGPLVINAK